MRFGLFLMPSHPPERPLVEGHQWDLQVLRWADALGFDEAWIGEHYTCAWEPNPAPDLLIAQALMQTSRIRLGTGGFIMPYHHPVEIYHRAIVLDHLSGGRFNFGMAPGSLQSDMNLFGQSREENRERLKEAIRIIRLLSLGEEFEYQGSFWNAARPKLAPGAGRAYHLQPVQKPHPPIAMTGGFSERSETLVLAGSLGIRPLSFNMSAHYVRNHWASVEEGAAESGRTPRRSDWGVVREALVAETDAEAWELAVNGMIGRAFREFFIPYFGQIGLLHYWGADADVAADAITVDYLARNNWLIGSPATVAAKLCALHDEIGGFGTLLVPSFDYSDHPDAWRRSLELLTTEVAPAVADLGAETVPTPATAQ